jgi:hypothetical protein
MIRVLAALALLIPLHSLAQTETFVIQGDTQTWSTATGPGWIDTNRAICQMRPALMIGTGDIVEFHGSTMEWDRARAAFDVLKNCGVPFSPAAGNHDWNWPTTNKSWLNYDAFNKRLGYEQGRTFSPTRRAWIMRMGREHMLGVLPDEASLSEIDWLSNALMPYDRVVLMQHAAVDPFAWKVTPQTKLVRDRLGARVVGVIGGHWLPADKVRFGTLPGGEFGLFTNYQRGLEPPTLREGWVTLLKLTATSWCVRTQNLLNGAQNYMEPFHCVARKK